MALLRLLVIAFLSFLCVNCELNNNFLRDAYYQASREYVDNYIKYLNSIDTRLYNYKYISLLNAQKKVDNELSLKKLRLEVEGTCRTDLQSPCADTIFICNGVVAYLNGQYETRPGSSCKAKLNPQDSTQLTEEPIVITRSKKTYCTGCPIDLDTNVEGLSTLLDTALNHIDSEHTNKHKVVKVLRVQQQIVAGVKYTLLLEVVPTTCPKTVTNIESCPLDSTAVPEICEVVYHQKPWISKAKHIISNNCTQSQDYVASDSNNQITLLKIDNEADNEIDANLHKKGDDGSSANPAWLADLESQIIPSHVDDSIFTAERKDGSLHKNNAQVGNVGEDSIKDDSLFVADQPKPPCTSTEEDEKDVKLKHPQVKSLDHRKGDDSSDESDDFEETKEKKTHKHHKKDDSSDENDDSDETDEHKVHKHNRRDDSSDESDEIENKHKDQLYEKTHDIENHEINKTQENHCGHDEVDCSSSSSSDSSSSEEHKSHKRHKRSLGEDTQNEKSVIKHLAGIAASTLDEIDEDNRKRIVLHVLDYKRDVLKDGIKYNLNLRMGVSRCSEDISSIPLPKYDPQEDEICKQNILQNMTKTCKVEILVNDEKTSPKILKSKCYMEKSDDGFYKKRIARQTRPGGIEEISPDDTSVFTFLQDTLPHLDAKSSHDNKYKVVQVVHASKQVVSGLLFRISALITLSDCSKADQRQSSDCGVLQGAETKSCEISIWDQPWLENGRETNITCEDGNSHSFRSKRDTSHLINNLEGNKNQYHNKRVTRQVRVGGSTEINSDDPHVTTFLQSSLLHLDANSGNDNKYKIIEVLKATRQVVAGVLYRIRARVVLSDCSKSDLRESQNCGVLEGVESQICDITVWDQPWLENGRETNITCEDGNQHSFRAKRDTSHLLGKDDHDLNLGLFKDFMKKHNRVYDSKTQYKYRFRVFRHNLKKIRYFNKHEQGTAKYGVNQFADWTSEEYKRLLGYKPSLKQENDIDFTEAEIPDIELPIEFDWRSKGVVTEVKNQGMCGSCWAFSTTGNIEGQYAIKHGKLLEFSEQELVDCDKTDDGCGGGLMDNAYRAIEKLGGLETEENYPYEAEGESCHFNKSLAVVELSGALNISHNETDMAKWLVQNGPISIAINANAMQFYLGGVSHPWKFLCDPNNLDHGVLIVGYGVHKYPYLHKTLPYWIVKNSWGRSWGQQGYYLVYRGDGTCGLNQTPSSAIVV